STNTLAVATTAITGYEVDAFKDPSAARSPANAGTTGTPVYTNSTGPAADVRSVITGNNGGFLASATGNVDNDADVDTWWVGTGSMTIAPTGCNDAQNAPAGNPGNTYNDVVCP
ncbi:MAG: hypothetical protein JNG84_15445, partial [Archangium sp.]|nr:hypothetical protein [Archangium sp.]